MESTPELEQPLAEAIEPPPPQPSTAHYIFFGPFGLRAGWSLLIYFAILAAIVFGISTMRHQSHSQPEPDATAAAAKASTPDADQPELMKSMITGEAIVFATLFFLSCLMAAIERRRLSVFGLGGRRSISRFLIGAVWGFAAMSLLIATLCGFHLLAFDTRLDHGPSIFFWGAIQLFAFLLTGFAEEYIFRGYLQFTLTRGLVGIGNFFSPQHARVIAFWIASVITSAIFLYAHTRNPGENWVGLFQVFLAGLLFVVALWRTGSLWWAIGFHMSWDWAQSFLYGVPDSGLLEQGRLFATHALGKPIYSGGTVGPEGSVLCCPIILLVIIVLLYTRPSPQPPLETISDSLLPELPHADTTSLAGIASSGTLTKSGKRTSGAKAPSSFQRFTARLKPCP
jgi:hypothetical protein